MNNLINYANYGPFLQMAQHGFCKIQTIDITEKTWDMYFNGLKSILDDGIDLEQVHSMYAIVVFPNNIEVKLYAVDLFINLICWKLIIDSGEYIEPCNIFFDDAITRGNIIEYINTNFLEKYMKKFNIFKLNNIIHNMVKYLNIIDKYSFYLANTYSLNDDVEMMIQNPRVYDILHPQLSDNLEEMQRESMDLAHEYAELIKNSDHCLSNQFRCGEGVNIKQFKEQYIALGALPDGMGNVHPFGVKHSFINGGLAEVPEMYLESANGINAQIISKTNVGNAGSFSRLLSLNGQDSLLHQNPNYVCDSKHRIKIKITNKRIFKNLIGRYFSLTLNGVERLLTKHDTHLIGQEILLRSPMTCASKHHYGKVCARCYGELYYVNRELNVGQIAGEIVSAQLTQRELSAKHLLEAKINSATWSDTFLSYFNNIFNLLVLADDVDVKNYKLVIYASDIISDSDTESEEDTVEVEELEQDTFGDYVECFYVGLPDGRLEKMSGVDQDGDPMIFYINPDIKSLINKQLDKDVDEIEIPFTQLVDRNVFSIDIRNNELSKTLNNIKTLINLNRKISSDKDQFIQNLMDAVDEGDLGIYNVHLEMILSNQIRSADDILELVDWSRADARYQCMALSKALSHNPSITITMSYRDIKRALKNPITYRKYRPSTMDLVFMKQPQEYMDRQ